MRSFFVAIISTAAATTTSFFPTIETPSTIYARLLRNAGLFSQNLLPKTTEAKNTEPRATNDETAALSGQQAFTDEPAYDINDRGQFRTPQEYARAVTDQTGLPFPLALTYADTQRSLITNALQLNSAFADWLDVLQQNMVDPAQALGEPILAGMDAAASTIPQPLIASALPIIAGAAELILTSMSAMTRLPTDLLIETPRQEMDTWNEFIESLSPVQIYQDQQ